MTDYQKEIIELIQKYLEQQSGNDLNIWLSGILGVVVGFALYFIRDRYENRKKRKKKKNAIINELRTNLGLIDQKKDILNKLSEALEKREILNTGSASYSTSLYDKHIGDVGMDLSIIQLSCLHIIYEHFKFIDSYLNNFFNEFLEKNKSGQIEDIFTNSINDCNDVIKKCDQVKELAEGYLQGNPKNVLWYNQKESNINKKLAKNVDILQTLLNKNK